MCDVCDAGQMIFHIYTCTVHPVNHTFPSSMHIQCSQINTSACKVAKIANIVFVEYKQPVSHSETFNCEPRF